MRKTLTLIICFATFGCREAEVLSTPYKKADGTIAFAIQRYEHGFNIQALDPSGRPSLTLMKVGQCKSGLLLWDRKDSVLFTYERAEITYLADGFDHSTRLALSVCRIGSPGCNTSSESDKSESIPVSCG